MKEEGLRFNDGKTRYDLIPPFAIEQLAKVFTKGAEKYAPRNWEKGMSWTKVLASLKRHIAAFERGEDFDKESGLYHMAHAMTNAAFILEYYKIFPQGDDRNHAYLSDLKIGLDIDDVICDFFPKVAEKLNLPTPNDWEFTYDKDSVFDKLDDEFFLSLPPKIKPEEMLFTPYCYITSRQKPSIEITKKWIEANGFPCVPVYTSSKEQSKAELAKFLGLDLFIDDNFETFTDMNRNGITCFLQDASWNSKYDVGFKRIKNVNDIFNNN